MPYPKNGGNGNGNICKMYFVQNKNNNSLNDNNNNNGFNIIKIPTATHKSNIDHRRDYGSDENKINSKNTLNNHFN